MLDGQDTGSLVWLISCFIALLMSSWRVSHQAGLPEGPPLWQFIPISWQTCSNLPSPSLKTYPSLTSTSPSCYGSNFCLPFLDKFPEELPRHSVSTPLFPIYIKLASPITALKLLLFNHQWPPSSHNGYFSGLILIYHLLLSQLLVILSLLEMLALFSWLLWLHFWISS